MGECFIPKSQNEGTKEMDVEHRRIRRVQIRQIDLFGTTILSRIRIVVFTVISLVFRCSEYPPRSTATVRNI
jgi:hypothetical protein